MAITKWTYRNPWRELDTLTNRLSRMIEDEFPVPSNGGTWLPAVNVAETPDELVLTAELPGMGEEDVEVELENNVLTIRGEKSEERSEGDDDLRHHVWERRYGAFDRSFTLPRTVKADSITADFEHGVLRVHMPKIAEAKSRKITIGPSGSIER